MEIECHPHVDQYIITKFIGEGKSSLVYRGFDTIQRHWVALKLFKSNNLASFSSELKFLTRVPHH